MINKFIKRNKNYIKGERLSFFMKDFSCFMKLEHAAINNLPENSMK